MSDFIRNLLIGEAQPDPYVWAAVLLAHAMIGVFLMSTILPLYMAASLYLAVRFGWRIQTEH